MIREPDEAGGAIPGRESDPSFRLWRSQSGDLPVLLAVPHDGRRYPDTLLERMRDPANTCPRLEDRHVGQIGHQIAAEIDVSFLAAEAPRAMLDLNRSADDIDWGMVMGSKPKVARHSMVNRRARNGLGLIPRRIPGMGEIWRGPVSVEDLNRRIALVYTPYHAALGRELDRLRDVWGAALLVDLHSMPPLRRSTPGELPAEFVLGDRFGASCDGGLADLAMRYLGGHGRRVAHNRPYAGGHMLDRYGQPVRGIHAIQIEVCRSLYLDSRLDQPSARLSGIGRLLGGLVQALGHEVAEMGRPTRLAQAAE
ncbi:N-formylglutamate amidohydrolase [Qipengyuania zhejiangensis]|uniref:N-formylglutamate amidohydrolase n=1 Tax=Qipengyuania zhejiangensis TaxID=3077782 RepID=UPI002D789134|nr:N-formylglutamate amidohydrolase [Qipengyuania sp. Z2]